MWFHSKSISFIEFVSFFRFIPSSNLSVDEKIGQAFSKQSFFSATGKFAQAATHAIENHKLTRGQMGNGCEINVYVPENLDMQDIAACFRDLQRNYVVIWGVKNTAFVVLAFWGMIVPKQPPTQFKNNEKNAW